MKIFVRTISGIVALEIDENETFENIKAKLETKLGKSYFTYKMMYAGKILEGTTKVNSVVGISEDSVIDLVATPTPAKL